ncbi:hypothetical protein [uncultured Clostridium sp.]|uniref:hypothetical protein n=1 Tax=uncultured Clostridium sp. TaxID=59620 RepID=UPI0028E2876D|nr:hypothetical protein [uncultured Clostridium sp.]
MVKRKKVAALILTISLVCKFMYVNFGMINNNTNVTKIEAALNNDNIIMYYDPHPKG